MTANSSVWPKLPVMVAKLASLDQTPIASVWVDAEGIIGYINQRFSQLLGYASHDLVGKSLNDVVPSLDIDYWQRAWWPLLENEQQIPALALSWQHQQGVAMDYNASISHVDVAGLSFASFYLWPLPLEPQDIPAFCDKDVAILLHHLGESVCLLDDSGVIRFANKAFCQLVACPEHNLIGLPLLEIISPTNAQFQDVWNVVQKNETKTECEFKDLSGKTRHIRMTAVPLNEETRYNKQTLVSFVDITEQVNSARELEAQNASFERLASNIPGFIYKFRMTPDGQFAFPYASQGCKDIFGVDPQLVINDATPIVQTIHPDDLPAFQNSIMESATHLSPWNFEARQKTLQGEWKWFHAASRPQLKDGGDVIWEGLVMDVTARKKVEAELADAKLAAETSTKVKAEFLANMSHEIRTPLNAIIGLNHLVLKSELNHSQRDYLQKVQLSSKNLLGIINNILDFSKIESGKLAIEQSEFNLDSVLENIGIMLEPFAANKHIELLIDRDQSVPLYLIGDSLRLIQVLTNLCSNAIKFTEQGEVIISITKTSVDDQCQQIRFAVKDTGIGLSEQQKNKVFAAFSQADNSITRNYGGTGLGLTISKHLIELMGGTIGVNSIEGKGSEFYFTLPLLDNPDAQFIETVTDQLAGWHVLLITENESSCRIYEKMLNDLRLKVSICSLWNMNLGEILKNQQSSEHVAHELILLDWKINEGHKADILRALDEQAFGKLTPVIVNISQTEVDSIKYFIERYENIAFLNKPNTPSCLMDAIVNASGKESLLNNFKIEQDSSNFAFYQSAVKGIRVLVVEDNEINQEVIIGLLESAEITVTAVNNGKEALDHLLMDNTEDQYDLILMDLQMPVMDGFEATTKLRKNRRFDALPIIAMTAYTIDTDKQKCLQVGMQDHVSKPIELEKMFATLARWTNSEKNVFELSSEQFVSATKSETESSELVLDALSTVNVQSALLLLQGSEKVLLRLLLKFAHEQQTVSEQIKQWLDNGDWVQAAEKTHQIKGVAGNLHITQVFEVSGKLETALKNHEQNTVDQLLDLLTLEMSKYYQEVTSLPAPEEEADAKEAEVLSGDQLITTQKLLEQLINYLNTNNWQAEDCLEQVRCKLNGHYQKELEIIEDYLIELDFSTASESVKKLRDSLYESL